MAEIVAPPRLVGPLLFKRYIQFTRYNQTLSNAVFKVLFITDPSSTDYGAAVAFSFRNSSEPFNCILCLHFTIILSCGIYSATQPFFWSNYLTLPVRDIEVGICEQSLSFSVKRLLLVASY